MSVGTQSWQDINFLVYADEPLLAVKLEQQIVAAIPNVEVQIDSFEVYEEALDYCKQKANVGVILIHENSGKLELSNAYEQLAKVYATSGWPVVGAIIRKTGIESIPALKLMRKQPGIVAYVTEEMFERPSEIHELFQNLWNARVEELSRSLFPTALKDTFVSAISNKVQEAEHVFYDRLSTVLTAPLNLSWKEGFQIRWHGLVSQVNKHAPALLAPHAALQKLVLDGSVDANASIQSVLSIAGSKKGLATRTIELSRKVVDAANDGNLAGVLQEAKTENRPGRPGLLRTLASRAQEIESIYADTYQSESNAPLRKAIGE